MNLSTLQVERAELRSTIQATDYYFEPVHQRWHRVPPHWVGDLVSSHTFTIVSEQNAPDTATK